MLELRITHNYNHYNCIKHVLSQPYYYYY